MDDADTTAVGSLLAWLRVEPSLRGRVEPVGSAPRPGSLGTLADVLTVALGAGGAASGLTSALIAWIRRRSGDTVVRVTRSDGSSIELRATAVRGLDPNGLATLAREVGASLAGPSEVAAAPSADDE
ncbi:effector-associated constant component EACC1 [Kitasatospora cineracea]|uniref:effector-associated constant component EACC1 n=1 Tax=Kitasatospora cineracea TaxID=88074 RepID=UPI0037A8E94E